MALVGLTICCLGLYWILYMLVVRISKKADRLEIMSTKAHTSTRVGKYYSKAKRYRRK